MEEINLLQNRGKEHAMSWERQARLMLTVLVFIFILLVAGWGGIFILNKTETSKLNEVKGQNQSLSATLAQKEASLDGAKAFQAQLINLKSLLSQHVYLTPLLDQLAKMTYIKAQYTTVATDAGGNVQLQGTVSNYSDLGKLLLGLSTAPQFKNVKLLSVAPANETNNAYKFAIQFTIDPSLLTKN